MSSLISFVDFFCLMNGDDYISCFIKLCLINTFFDKNKKKILKFTRKYLFRQPWIAQLICASVFHVTISSFVLFLIGCLDGGNSRSKSEKRVKELALVISQVFRILIKKKKTKKNIIDAKNIFSSPFYSPNQLRQKL